jgi:hypothetical protein
MIHSQRCFFKLTGIEIYIAKVRMRPTLAAQHTSVTSTTQQLPNKCCQSDMQGHPMGNNRKAVLRFSNETTMKQQ